VTTDLEPDIHRHGRDTKRPFAKLMTSGNGPRRQGVINLNACWEEVSRGLPDARKFRYPI